jgi:hypothetical protein
MYRRRSPIFGNSVVFALVIAFCPSCCAAQTIQLPRPTGPFGIGRLSYDWIDEHRSDPSNNRAKREIVVDVWYPADVSRGVATAPLVPGASRLTGIPEQIMRDEQFKDAWAAVRSGAVVSHAVENAPAEKKLKNYAVLIFSPGLGSATYAYTSQLEDLASMAMW